jgi:hypothetical protein
VQGRDAGGPQPSRPGKRLTGYRHEMAGRVDAAADGEGGAPADHNKGTDSLGKMVA